MFSGLFLNTWIVATMVAVIAGAVGFFAVIRGSAFASHALPQAAFAGAAGASLLGISTVLGLGVFSGLSALVIALLGRRGRHDVATALGLVVMLGLGALFLSMSVEYAPALYSLLFGEVLGVSRGEILPTALIGLAALVTLGLLYRPLLLSSVMPEVAEARGVGAQRVEVAFLLVVALATTMTVPVVGAFLMFSLMIGPAGAACSLTTRPARALAGSVVIAVVVMWASIALSYAINWPIGFFVGALGATAFGVSRLVVAWRRSGLGHRVGAPRLGTEPSVI